MAKKAAKKKRKSPKVNYSKVIKDVRKEEFCRLFASDREFMGNGVQSYIESFEPDESKKNWYQTARTQSHRLLTNVHINGRIAHLIEAELNDFQADKQLSFLVAQNAEMSVKLGAIKEYNALKQRVVKKIEGNLTGEIKVIING